MKKSYHLTKRDRRKNNDCCAKSEGCYHNIDGGTIISLCSSIEQLTAENRGKGSGDTLEDKSNETVESVDTFPKQCVPKSKLQGLLKRPPSLLEPFNSKNTASATFANHSSHGVSLSITNVERFQTKGLSANSVHSRKLTEMIQANSGSGRLSVASVHRMLQADNDNSPDGDSLGGSIDIRHEIEESPGDNDDDLNDGGDSKSGWRSNGAAIPRKYSSFSSQSEEGLEMDNNALDIAAKSSTTAKILLESLGDDPSTCELENVAALRIKEMLSTEVSASDRQKWDGIKQFNRMDLVVGKHLGKGSFSDVFEIFATVAVDAIPTFETLDSDKEDLDRLMEAKFSTGSAVRSTSDLIEELNHDKASTNSTEFRPEKLVFRRGGIPKEPHHEEEQEKSTEFQPQRLRLNSLTTSGDNRPILRRRPTMLAGSVCLGNISRPQQERKVILAMKCLRPQIRAEANQFIVGVEDLVHETTMLASLDHPNIIKIHGRAEGCYTKSSRLSDGFFILLDRLQDSLTDRILRWKNQHGKKKGPPLLAQLNAACNIADAISFLHSKSILFRDLKPANVGFDSTGVLKLFDFGFAISVNSSPRDQSTTCSELSSSTHKPARSDLSSATQEEHGLLYDRCGTPRYMAPEVGLNLGYSFPSDVYSFGILLWEICALDKPFDSVKTADEFHKAVFKKGARPKLSKHWPTYLSDIMTKCWSNFPNDRPEMSNVKTRLTALAKDASMQLDGDSPKNMRKSFVFRRFTG
jgi:serine/threonine protein kinase